MYSLLQNGFCGLLSRGLSSQGWKLTTRLYLLLIEVTITAIGLLA